MILNLTRWARSRRDARALEEAVKHLDDHILEDIGLGRSRARLQPVRPIPDMWLR